VVPLRSSFNTKVASWVDVTAVKVEAVGLFRGPKCL
jgi:hypothetical protein